MIELGKWASAILAVFAVLGIIGGGFVWAENVKQTNEEQSEELKELRGIASSLAEIHKRQQTEREKAEQMCRLKQATREWCERHDYPHGIAQ